MSDLIGLDSGCAYIKCVKMGEDGEFIEFSVPSLAKTGAATVGMGGVSGITYECRGEEWSINPNKTSSEDTRFDGYTLSPMNLILSTHTLLEMGLSGRVPVSSGLPINQFFTEKSGPNKDLINQKHQMYNNSVLKLGKKGFSHVDLTFDSVKVCPEALGGWVDICMDSTGDMVQEVHQPVGLVDIGGRTTDIALALPGFEIDSQYTGTIKTGYLDILATLNRLLREKYKTGDIEVSTLEKAAREGTIELFMGEEAVDIAVEVKKARSMVSGEIMREVGRRFSNVKHMAGTCYFGGGAEDMRDDLQKEKNVFIPERPQFANARGYWKIARFL